MLQQRYEVMGERELFKYVINLLSSCLRVPQVRNKGHEWDGLSFYSAP